MAIISNSGANWIKHEHYTVLTIFGAFIVLSGAILTIIRKNRQTKSIR